MSSFRRCEQCKKVKERDSHFTANIWKCDVCIVKEAKRACDESSIALVLSSVAADSVSSSCSPSSAPGSATESPIKLQPVSMHSLSAVEDREIQRLLTRTSAVEAQQAAYTPHVLAMQREREVFRALTRQLSVMPTQRQALVSAAPDFEMVLDYIDEGDMQLCAKVQQQHDTALSAELQGIEDTRAGLSTAWEEEALGLRVQGLRAKMQAAAQQQAGLIGQLQELQGIRHELQASKAECALLRLNLKTIQRQHAACLQQLHCVQHEAEACKAECKGLRHANARLQLQLQDAAQAADQGQAVFDRQLRGVELELAACRAECARVSELQAVPGLRDEEEMQTVELAQALVDGHLHGIQKEILACKAVFALVRQANCQLEALEEDDNQDDDLLSPFIQRPYTAEQESIDDVDLAAEPTDGQPVAEPTDLSAQVKILQRQLSGSQQECAALQERIDSQRLEADTEQAELMKQVKGLRQELEDSIGQSDRQLLALAQEEWVTSELQELKRRLMVSEAACASLREQNRSLGERLRDEQHVAALEQADIKQQVLDLQQELQAAQIMTDQPKPGIAVSLPEDEQVTALTAQQRALASSLLHAHAPKQTADAKNPNRGALQQEQSSSPREADVTSPRLDLPLHCDVQIALVVPSDDFAQSGDQSQIMELEQAIKELQMQLTSSENHCNALSAANDKLKTQQQHKDALVTDLGQKLNDAQAECLLLNQKLLQQNATGADLQHQLEESQNECLLLRSTSSACTSTIGHQNRTICELEEQLQKTKAAYGLLQGANAERQKLNSEQQESTCTLPQKPTGSEAEFQSLMQKLEDEKATVETLQQQLEESTKARDQRNASAVECVVPMDHQEVTAEGLQQQLESTSAALRRAKSPQDQLQEELQYAKTETQRLHKMKGDHKTVNSLHLAQMTEKQIDEMRQQPQESQDENAKLQRQMEQHASHGQELKRHFDTLREENDSWRLLSPSHTRSPSSGSVSPGRVKKTWSEAHKEMKEAERHAQYEVQAEPVEKTKEKHVCMVESMKAFSTGWCDLQDQLTAYRMQYLTETRFLRDANNQLYFQADNKMKVLEQKQLDLKRKVQEKLASCEKQCAILRTEEQRLNTELESQKKMAIAKEEKHQTKLREVAKDLQTSKDQYNKLWHSHEDELKAHTAALHDAQQMYNEKRQKGEWEEAALQKKLQQMHGDLQALRQENSKLLQERDTAQHDLKKHKERQQIQHSEHNAMVQTMRFELSQSRKECEALKQGSEQEFDATTGQPDRFNLPRAKSVHVQHVQSLQANSNDPLVRALARTKKELEAAQKDNTFLRDTNERLYVQSREKADRLGTEIADLNSQLEQKTEELDELKNRAYQRPERAITLPELTLPDLATDLAADLATEASPGMRTEVKRSSHSGDMLGLPPLTHTWMQLEHEQKEQRLNVLQAETLVREHSLHKESLGYTTLALQEHSGRCNLEAAHALEGKDQQKQREISAEYDALLTENQDLKAKLAAANTLEGKYEQQQQEITAARHVAVAENQDLKAKLEALEGKHQQQQEAIRAAHDAEDLRQQLEKWKECFGQLKVAHEKDAVLREAEDHQMQKDEEARKSEMASLRSCLEGVQRELVHTKDGLEHLKAALDQEAARREATERQVEAKDLEIESLRAQIDSLELDLADLAQERIEIELQRGKLQRSAVDLAETADELTELKPSFGESSRPARTLPADLEEPCTKQALHDSLGVAAPVKGSFTIGGATVMGTIFAAPNQSRSGARSSGLDAETPPDVLQEKALELMHQLKTEQNKNAKCAEQMRELKMFLEELERSEPESGNDASEVLSRQELVKQVGMMQEKTLDLLQQLDTEKRKSTSLETAYQELQASLTRSTEESKECQMEGDLSMERQMDLMRTKTLELMYQVETERRDRVKAETAYDELQASFMRASLRQESEAQPFPRDTA